MSLTLKKTSQRIIDGLSSNVAIKEHVDEFNRTFDPMLFQDEPALTGVDYLDAWFGASAQYEACMIDVQAPDWTLQKIRFLRTPYFIGGLNSRMIALVETPFAFRQRLLFIGKSTIKAPIKPAPSDKKD